VTEKTIYKLLGGGNVRLDIAERLSRTLWMTFRQFTEPELDDIEARRMKLAQIATNRIGFGVEILLPKRRSYRIVDPPLPPKDHRDARPQHCYQPAKR